MIFAKTFPRDVLVFDSESVLYARVERGRRRPAITRAKSYALPAGTFSAGITPVPENASAISAAIRRMRTEQGRIDNVSVLLPDSWFRITILDLASLPSKRSESDEVVRWALKRNLPIRPEDFRIAYQPLSRNGNVRVLVVAAGQKGLSSIESILREEGIGTVLIEPVGMNLWNSIASREPAAAGERLFFYLRNRDFTTALFRGTMPVFVRSRSLNAERTLVQEIRLSASYLRNALQVEDVAHCYLAGNQIEPGLVEMISEEFSSPAARVSLSDYADCSQSIDPARIEAELTACTGVFTA